MRGEECMGACRRCLLCCYRGARLGPEEHQPQQPGMGGMSEEWEGAGRPLYNPLSLSLSHTHTHPLLLTNTHTQQNCICCVFLRFRVKKKLQSWLLFSQCFYLKRRSSERKVLESFPGPTVTRWHYHCFYMFVIILLLLEVTSGAPTIVSKLVTGIRVSERGTDKLT